MDQMELATDAQVEVDTDDQIEDAAPDIVEPEADNEMVGTTYSYMSLVGS